MGVRQSRPYQERALFSFGDSRPYNNYGYSSYRPSSSLIEFKLGGKEQKTRKMKRSSRKTRKYRK